MVSFWGLGMVLALALAPLASTGPVIWATGPGTQVKPVAQSSDQATPVTLISLTDRIGEPTEIAVDGLLELAAASGAAESAPPSGEPDVAEPEPATEPEPGTEPAPASEPTIGPTPSGEPAIVTVTGGASVSAGADRRPAGSGPVVQLASTDVAPAPSQEELAGIAILTPPIATSVFFVAGVTWDSGEELSPDIEISMRVFEHGQWSDWLELEPDGGDGGGGRGRAGTDPFVTGGAEAMQIQISGDPALLPPGLDLSLIPSNPLPPSEAVTQTPAEPAPAPSSEPIAPEHDDSAVAAPAAATLGDDDPVFSLAGWTQPARESGSGLRYELAAVDPRTVAPRPAITTREQWGADAATTTWSPHYATLQAAIVHHTAGTNSYSASQSPQIVRGIHYFHAVTRDWGDIGYNFLVDRYGQVFEGRKGTLQAGDSTMVQGAHARGYNSGSMGLSAMGDFTLQSAPQVILDRMADVIAWRFSLAGIDVRTESGFTSPGSSYRGAGQALPRVFGHGDVASTTCPSADIYGRLVGLRSAVESRIRAAQAGRFSPFGSFDHVQGVPGGLSLRGWAIDPDTDNPLYIWVTVDGVGRHILANSSRPDVSRYYPSFSDNHGYDAVIPAAAGARRVCVTVSNVGLGDHKNLGCKTADVPGGPPVGALEDLRAVPGGIDLQGWALDPDTTSPVYLWVTVDGSGRHVLADGVRADVAANYPEYGSRYGFDTRLSVAPGDRRICVTASNRGAGSHKELGCRDVTVRAGSPFGNFEAASAVPGGIEISGWGIDPDTTDSIYMWVTVDGRGRHLAANQPRGDVGRAYPGYGPDRGFRETVSAAPGLHRVCVTAANVLSGSHTGLWCRSVVVTD